MLRRVRTIVQLYRVCFCSLSTFFGSLALFFLCVCVWKQIDNWVGLSSTRQSGGNTTVLMEFELMHGC